MPGAVSYGEAGSVNHDTSLEFCLYVGTLNKQVDGYVSNILEEICSYTYSKNSKCNKLNEVA